MSTIPSLLNYSQVAEILGVSQITVRRWVSERKIPCKKIGRSVRFDLDELLLWIHEQSVPAGGRR